MATTTQYRSRFGDTTLTKVFVGGLAWETPNEDLRRYFEQFGEILEAVIITDKNTGRSKGYGFVTFQDPDSARRACVDQNPVIDGRRANCNIASLGRPRPSPPRGRTQAVNPYQGGPQASAYTPYSRFSSQIPPPPPPPVIFPPPYGYMTYPTDYGYQQPLYNPQLAPQYYHHIYGTSSSSGAGAPYHYPTHAGYSTVHASPRASFSSGPQQAHHPMQGSTHLSLPGYVNYPIMPQYGEGSYASSTLQPHTFQLQAPPTRQQPLNTADSQPPQPISTTVADSESSDG